MSENPQKDVMALLSEPFSILQMGFYRDPCQSEKFFVAAHDLIIGSMPKIAGALRVSIEEAAEQAFAAGIVLLRPVIRFIANRDVVLPDSGATLMPIWLAAGIAPGLGIDYCCGFAGHECAWAASMNSTATATRQCKPATLVEQDLIRRWALVLTERYGYAEDESDLLLGLVRNYRQVSPWGPDEP